MGQTGGSSHEGGCNVAIQRRHAHSLPLTQVGGVRSNLWPGAVCAAKGKAFSNLYVGWGIKRAPFVPLPPPPVAKEFDLKLVESLDLPPKPKPPPVEGEEAGDE